MQRYLYEVRLFKKSSTQKLNYSISYTQHSLNNYIFICLIISKLKLYMLYNIFQHCFCKSDLSIKSI